MKKILSVILSVSVLLAAGNYAADEREREISVIVDGHTVEFDTEPVIENDSTLVPMRAVFEALGADVEWSEQDRSIAANKDEINIKLRVGSAVMNISDNSSKMSEIELETPAQIINDRTYVPVRAISEAFGCRVLWEGWSRTVIVQSSAPDDMGEIKRQLIKYAIIPEADIDKDKYITTLEALKAMYQVENGGLYKAYLRDWYKGDLLAPLDYLDDETKNLLLSLSGGRGILEAEELLDLDFNSNLTEYQALVYLTRMIGDTYGCTDIQEELSYDNKSQTYGQAEKKGLIASADTSNADKAIEREYFYRLLINTLYTPYKSGGYGGVSDERKIDHLGERADRQAAATPTPLPKTAKRIEMDTNFYDDMSIHWTIPEKYSEWNGKISYITENGDIKLISSSVASSYDKIYTEDIIEVFSYENDSKPQAIRCEYYNGTEVEYFDIDLSNIELVREDYEIQPGVYTPFQHQWVPKYITLAEGYSFKKNTYYMIVSHEHEYRLEKYNYTHRMVIKSDKDTDIFSNEAHDSFMCGGIDFDDLHIREITIEGNAAEGFKLHMTPESTGIFEINKD